MPWTFKDRLEGRRNIVREWLDGLPLKPRLKIDQILRNLAVCDTLKPPFVKKIHGFEDLFEIVAEVNRVQYRPLGGYGPGNREFTIVLGAIEHNNNIKPPNAFATAAAHVARVKKRTCDVCNHDYEKPTPETANGS